MLNLISVKNTLFFHSDDKTKTYSPTSSYEDVGLYVKSGAEGGIRTPIGVTPEDFESSAYTVPPLRLFQASIFSKR